MVKGSGKNDSRSMRHGKWYWVDKNVIQERAKVEGLLTIAVYHFLASMADENQTCYPSQEYIAEKMGCSRGSVNKAVKRLVRGGMISVSKLAGKSMVYHLLPLDLYEEGTWVSRGVTGDVRQEDTNNNNEQDINNKTLVSVQETYDETGRPSVSHEALSKKELLAQDLVEGLGDSDHLAKYLAYAERYTEEFLRRVLAETKLTPESRIRKSRAALFSYLVNYYDGKRG